MVKLMINILIQFKFHKMRKNLVLKMDTQFRNVFIF